MKTSTLDPSASLPEAGKVAPATSTTVDAAPDFSLASCARALAVVLIFGVAGGIENGGPSLAALGFVAAACALFALARAADQETSK